MLPVPPIVTLRGAHAGSLAASLRCAAPEEPVHVRAVRPQPATPIALHAACGAPADMAPLYEEVCAELGVGGDAAALQQMRERNVKQLAEMEEKIKDAGKGLPRRPLLTELSSPTTRSLCCTCCSRRSQCRNALICRCCAQSSQQLHP